MAQLNRRSTAKAKAIAAKENSRAITVHALLITAVTLGCLLAVLQLAQ